MDKVKSFTCGACFGRCGQVVEEVYSCDQTFEALNRFYELLDAGDCPALCPRDDGTLYVCYCSQQLASDDAHRMLPQECRDGPGPRQAL